jgi:hypothetical protein
MFHFRGALRGRSYPYNSDFLRRKSQPLLHTWASLAKRQPVMGKRNRTSPLTWTYSQGLTVSIIMAIP